MILVQNCPCLSSRWFLHTSELYHYNNHTNMTKLLSRIHLHVNHFETTWHHIQLNALISLCMYKENIHLAKFFVLWCHLTFIHQQPIYFSSVELSNNVNHPIYNDIKRNTTHIPEINNKNRQHKHMLDLHDLWHNEIHDVIKCFLKEHR